MAALFRMEVHTPYRLFFAGSVETVVAELADGEIGILAGHSPFLAPLKTCALRVLKEDGIWAEAAVSAGVVAVDEDGVTVLSDAAEWPEEIDRERALEAERRAKETLGQDPFTFEKAQAQEALRRALNRLAVKERAGEAKP